MFRPYWEQLGCNCRQGLLQNQSTCLLTSRGHREQGVGRLQRPPFLWRKYCAPKPCFEQLLGKRGKYIERPPVTVAPAAGETYRRLRLLVTVFSYRFG